MERRKEGGTRGWVKRRRGDAGEEEEDRSDRVGGGKRKCLFSSLVGTGSYREAVMS